MQSLFTVIQTFIICCAFMAVTGFVLLSLPQSKLRAFLSPIVAWGIAIVCALYAISPVDLMPESILGPFGLFDDVGAVLAGIAAARVAMNSSKATDPKASE